MKKNIQKPKQPNKEIETQERDKIIDYIIRHFNVFSIIFITLIGIEVYSNSFNCSFHFDDKPNITENLQIRNLTNFTNVNYWLHPGRQLACLSFALNYHFNKLDVFGYHLINITIHIITGIFSFLFIKLILSLNNSKNINFNKHREWIALFSALFFVVHPLQTQAVSYIVQRMASMAAMFYIISIYLYALGRIAHTQKDTISKAIIFYLLALISGIMGVMSKENAATFPFAMLLFEFCFIRSKDNKIYKNYIIISFSSIAFLSVLYLLLNPTILTFGASGDFQINSLTYLVNQFVVIVRYLQLTLLPYNQCVDYGNPFLNYPFIQTFWRPDVIECLLLLIGIFILALYLFNKNKVLSFGIFWIFLTLSVESSIIPIVDPMFEHRMYLPMLGLGLFLICAFFLFFNKFKLLYKLFFLSIIIIVLGVTSYSRNGIWKNDNTLWSDVVKKAPYNARGWYNKGKDLSDFNRHEEAIKCFDEALRIKPDYYKAWDDKGISLNSLGKFEEAIKCYDEAIKIKPDFSLSFYNKGNAYFYIGKNSEAIKFFDESIKLNPDDFEAWNNKGSAFIGLGEFDEAIKNFDKAIELKYDYYEAWNNKGTSLYNLKKYEDAVQCYDEAIKIKEDYFQAWSNKGSALFNIERYEEAIKCYDNALKINPNYQEAVNNKMSAIEKLKKSGSNKVKIR
jgi:protein O-mannosyl-transferase